MCYFNTFSNGYNARPFRHLKVFVFHSTITRTGGEPWLLVQCSLRLSNLITFSADLGWSTSGQVNILISLIFHKKHLGNFMVIAYWYLWDKILADKILAASQIFGTFVRQNFVRLGIFSKYTKTPKQAHQTPTNIMCKKFHNKVNKIFMRHTCIQ